MHYNKIKFIFGSPVESGYQVVSDDGILIKITDLDGNELTLDNYGSECVLPNPRPDWAE